MNISKFRVSMAAKIIISILEIGLFSCALFIYYGPGMFANDTSIGYAVTLLLYVIVYIALGSLFRAFKITDYSISETAFSQFLSFGIADLLLYSEFCLISHGFVNLLPGVITLFCQCFVAVVWALIFKRFMLTIVRPEDTIVISGVQDASDFVWRMNKVDRMLHIASVVQGDKLDENWKTTIAPYQAVILYEMDMGLRSEIIRYCVEERKTLYLTPSLEEITMNGFGARYLIDTPMMKYEYRSERFWFNLIKRTTDVVVSFLGLIITSPILLFTAIAIKIDDRGPVFFKQKRCTKNGRIFEIIKFRSMIVDAEKDGKTIPCRSGDPRITRVGRVIRKTRVDELPQLINVLKGDMSLVGPRPERVEHVEEYTREVPEFAYRLRVKGGLTGYAQIYGKYNTSPSDKLKLDLQYIEQQSLLLDLKLILLTIKIVFVPESTEGFKEEVSAAVSEKAKKLEELEP